MSGLFDYAASRFHPMDTSVDDATQRIRKSTSLPDLRDWLKHERDGRGRTTVIKALGARIRRIEKALNA